MVPNIFTNHSVPDKLSCLFCFLVLPFLHSSHVYLYFVICLHYAFLRFVCLYFVYLSAKCILVFCVFVCIMFLHLCVCLQFAFLYLYLYLHNAGEGECKASAGGRRSIFTICASNALQMAFAYTPLCSSYKYKYLMHTPNSALVTNKNI